MRGVDPDHRPRPGPEAEASSLSRLIGPYVPSDHARQVEATAYIARLMREDPPPHRVMDLGCGSGGSVDLFRAHDPHVDWVGVDIGDSMEVAARARQDATFVTYDGETLPFPDASFDIVYSRQVLEHVRDPRRHLAEVRRVLRPGGAYAGSTSQLRALSLQELLVLHRLRVQRARTRGGP